MLCTEPRSYPSLNILKDNLALESKLHNLKRLQLYLPSRKLDCVGHADPDEQAGENKISNNHPCLL
jgi:hypothetical protein